MYEYDWDAVARLEMRRLQESQGYSLDPDHHPVSPRDGWSLPDFMGTLRSGYVDGGVSGGMARRTEPPELVPSQPSRLDMIEARLHRMELALARTFGELEEKDLSVDQILNALADIKSLMDR